ncbi:MAG: LytR/AlgR family response regulator transcription factor [Bacteroidia bacterium]
MRTLIIDNEPKIVKGLQHMLKRHCPSIQLVGVARGVEDGLDKIAALRPDLIFLDVEMDDGTGIDLLQKLEQRHFQVIFITAYNHYALDAFRCSAIDFLPKPIDPLDLSRAVQKAQLSVHQSFAQARLEVLLSQPAAASTRKLVLRDTENYHVVPVGSIIHCQAEGSYTRFYLEGGCEILVSKNLKEYEKLLQSSGFFRPHNSHLVHLDHIVRLNKADCILVLNDGTEIPVSTRKKEQLMKLLTAQGG